MTNLFANVPRQTDQEHFTELLSAPGIRIERIVSTGQFSPPGFWYQQQWTEWVAVLQGEAELTIAGEVTPRTLRPGDHVLLPAGLRHRVERTSASPPTIWLAVHFNPAGQHSTQNPLTP